MFHWLLFVLWLYSPSIVSTAKCRGLDWTGWEAQEIQVELWWGNPVSCNLETQKIYIVSYNNINGGVYSLEYTVIQKVFLMSLHVGHRWTNAIEDPVLWGLYNLTWYVSDEGVSNPEKVSPRSAINANDRVSLRSVLILFSPLPTDRVVFSLQVF